MSEREEQTVTWSRFHDPNVWATGGFKRVGFWRAFRMFGLRRAIVLSLRRAPWTQAELDALFKETKSNA